MVKIPNEALLIGGALVAALVLFKSGRNTPGNNTPININPFTSFLDKAQTQAIEVQESNIDTLQNVKHCFEQDKLQLQEIPWRDVPIPPPQLNVKILGEMLNNQKRARKKMMQLNAQCKDENCENEKCGSESSEKESEESETVTKTRICKTNHKVGNQEQVYALQ